jgi:hypothetical protein
METRKRAIAFRKLADIDIPKQEKVKPYSHEHFQAERIVAIKINLVYISVIMNPPLNY